MCLAADGALGKPLRIQVGQNTNCDIKRQEHPLTPATLLDRLPHVANNARWEGSRKSLIRLKSPQLNRHSSTGIAA